MPYRNTTVYHKQAPNVFEPVQDVSIPEWATMRAHKRRRQGHRAIVPRPGRLPPHPLAPADVDGFPRRRVYVEAAGEGEGPQGAPWLGQVGCQREAGFVPERVVTKVQSGKDLQGPQRVGQSMAPYVCYL